MRRIVTLLFMFGFLLPLFGAEPNDVTVCEVTGQGKDRNDAIRNALYIAVSQVRGTRVGSGSYELGYFGGTVDVNDDKPTGKTVEFDAVSIEASGTASTTATGGLVKKYEILEEKQLDIGMEVTLKAWVYNLADAEKPKRIKIAVMPVKTMLGLYLFVDLQTPSENLASIVAHKLTIFLAETNKFDVLDRNNIVDFVREAKMLAIFDAPLSEQAKLAETMGADYLLASIITDASITRTQEIFVATGQPHYEYEGWFALNYSLVKSTTKQIVKAGTVEILMENEEFSRVMRETDQTKWNNNELRDMLVEVAALEASKEISESIYSIKVVGFENGNVVLDHAGTKLPTGTIVEIFKQGQEFFDEDTKQSLGRSEEYVAAVRIISVSQKVSFAELIDGDLNNIAKGQICRVRYASPQNRGLKSGSKRMNNGGVKLPFDK